MILLTMALIVGLMVPIWGVSQIEPICPLPNVVSNVVPNVVSNLVPNVVAIILVIETIFEPTRVRTLGVKPSSSS